MRKIVIILTALLAGTLLMAYFYFSRLKLENSTNDVSLNAITSNSALIFSFENDKSFYEILKDQEIFGKILGETKARQLAALRENLIPEAALEGQKIYIGFIPGTSDKIDFIIGTQFKAAADPSAILNTLNSKKIQLSNYQQLKKLTFPDSNVVYLGIKDKLILISGSAGPIAKVMKAENHENQDFTNYIKENSRHYKNVLANLYIDFAALPALLKPVLNTRLNGELSIFNEQNGYAALSYNFSSETLLFNGITTITQANSYYKLFENLPAQKLFINNILPQKTANYTIFAIADYPHWYEELSRLRASRKETDRITKNEQQINQKYGLDLASILPRYFKNQFVTFQLNTGEKFGAIALSNGEKVEQLLIDLSAEYAPDIRVLRANSIPYTYFGEPFKKFEKPYYTIIDNYLVMANNASSIQVFLNNYRNNQLLINDSGYQHFNNQLSTATLSFYLGNENANRIFGRNLKAPYFRQYLRKLDGFEAFGLQLSGDKGKFLSNLLLAKKARKLADTTTIE